MMQMGCISWQALCSISCDMYPQHNSYCEAVTYTKLQLHSKSYAGVHITGNGTQGLP